MNRCNKNWRLFFIGDFSLRNTMNISRRPSFYDALQIIKEDSPIEEYKNILLRPFTSLSIVSLEDKQIIQLHAEVNSQDFSILFNENSPKILDPYKLFSNFMFKLEDKKSLLLIEIPDRDKVKSHQVEPLKMPGIAQKIKASQ
ncbi:hypothetical protein SM124_08840 [Bacillus sp. 31A1R]|uniref:Uncharacterized protein n=1 Tax=Robertmurraya mangrovi TaxID=3098077 RepID=A0ABU5IXG2_9BACI|nr:hypothetical protein [Bacillus sp. 31A1R]MDZ5471854.1 hypothetical protein [Bacillus sp. 31A1R]